MDLVLCCRQKSVTVTISSAKASTLRLLATLSCPPASPYRTARATTVSRQSSSGYLLWVLAELSGFASYLQERVILRAGSNFNVDVTMRIGGVEETITVTADTPMLEIASPGNIMNVDGEFQREMPIQARRNWSDFLELTPGVNARPFDDGSGRISDRGHVGSRL